MIRRLSKNVRLNFPVFLIALIFFYCLPARVQAEDLPAAMMYRNKPVDPACLLLDLEDDSQTTRSEYRLSGCLPKEARLDTALPEGPDALGYVGYEFTRSFVSEDGSSGTQRWSYRYKYLGVLRGHHVTLVEFSNDDNETFTQIKFFDRVDDRLVLINRIDGGDRCSSGIVDAFIQDEKLHYTINIMASDFPALGGDDDQNLKITQDLESATDSCFGVAHYVEGAFVSLSLNPDIFAGVDDPEKISEPPLQGCFNSVFSKYLDEGRGVLDRGGMSQFMKDFHEACPM